MPSGHALILWGGYPGHQLREAPPSQFVTCGQWLAHPGGTGSLAAMGGGGRTAMAE